jgi:tellurite resistance protein
VTRAYPPGWDRLTPNYFGMPFGILGLAAAWKAAVGVLAVPDWINAALLIFGAVLWLAITAAYAVKLGRRPAAVLAEFTDITLSPFGAFAPVAVMLLGVGLLPYARRPGEVIVALGSLLTLGYAGWWLAGRILGPGERLEQVHSGYLIPVPVAGFLASSAALAAGWAPVARLWFGAALAGWAGFGSLSLARLVLRPEPDPPLRPTMAIDAALAGAAGVTYFNLYGLAHPGLLAYAAAGYGLVMLAAEAWLLPQYARLGFGVGDWVFAFSTAVIATDVLRWTASAGAPRWPAWLVLAAASAVSGWLVARTPFALLAARRTRSGPVTQPG